MSDSSSPLLPHGGYEKLRAYVVAEAVYDATVVFCNRFIDRRSRTHDQMVQAARSGVRNISEGSGAAATSRKTEMKLTNVARQSERRTAQGLQPPDTERPAGLAQGFLGSFNDAGTVEARCRARTAAGEGGHGAVDWPGRSAVNPCANAPPGRVPARGSRSGVVPVIQTAGAPAHGQISLTSETGLTGLTGLTSQL